MLPSAWIKVINDVWGNKTRSMLIILSIAVGLFAVGMTINARQILAVELAKNYAAVNPSSGVVRTIESFDESFVNSVRHMTDVEEADARRIFTARVYLAHQQQWRDLTIFAINDFEDMKVNKIHTVSGAFPPAKREILIERSGIKFLNVNEGDILKMETPDQKQCNMQITGIVHDLVQLPSDFDGTPYAYISFEGLDCFGEPQGFNELAVVAKNKLDKAHAQQVVSKVKDKAEKSGYTIPLSLVAEPGQLPLDDVLQTVLLVLSGLGMLSLLLSAFLIINTFTSLVTQQMRQIGVMKAIGASNGQIMGIYLGMVLCYAVAAVIISIPLGIIGADWLSKFMASLFNFNLGNYDIPTQAIYIQITVGILIPILSACYPLLANLHITAAEAMNHKKTSWGANWIDLLISGKNLWFSRNFMRRPWILSLRNTFRSKGRLMLTLATLSLAGAVFINVFSINASMMYTMDDMMRLFGFDLWIAFSKPYRTQLLVQEALQVPHAVKADVWLQLPSRRVRPDGSESGLVYLFAPISDSEIVKPPSIIAGRWLQTNDEHAIVINSNLAKDEKDLQVGSPLVLKINGHDETFMVIGSSLGMGVPMVYANYTYIANITGNSGKASSVLISAEKHDPQNVAHFSTVAEAYFRKRGFQISSIQSMSNERAEAQASFNILTSLLLLMALLLAIVGGFSLMGTMSINVIERTREIGVLRAIGASDISVGWVFIMEGVVIGSLSWFIGCIASFIFGKITSDIVGISLMGTPLTYKFSMQGVWLWLLLVLLISAIASIIPARNATRLTVREVLAYE